MEFTNISSCNSNNNNGVKLLDAAIEGEADEAVEVLARDPTLIHIADAMEDTAFHIAARAGHRSTVLKMMEFLKVGHGKVLEKVLLQGNTDGDRPLHLALKNGHKDVSFDLAFDKNITMFIKNDDGKNGFDLAKEAGIHLSYEPVSSDPTLPLVVKDEDGHEEVVMRLTLAEHSATFKQTVPRLVPLVGRVDIQMKVARMSIENENNDGNNDEGDEEKFLKLYVATGTNKEDVVEEIIKNNPNILEHKCTRGRTALHLAARGGNIGPLKKMVDFIMQYNNSNLNKLLLEADNNDCVPLHFALLYRREKVARYLVEVAPRAVYKQNRWGESPLQLAIDKDYPDLIRYMTRTEDLSQSIRDRVLEHAKKVGIGHYALKKRNLATFEAILEGLPDLINVPDRKGWKLLSYAASKGYFDEVCYILKRFPNSPRITDEDKSYPIHKAVVGGHISVVKELLLHCPQALQDIDRKSRNPFEIATLYKKYDVLSYLKEINI